MFSKINLKSILEKVKRGNRTGQDYGPNNILFLDYDGVISLDFSLETFRPVFDPDCMANVNRLCREFDLKIVVTSSWRDMDDYAEMLYENGLDKQIKVMGKTDDIYGSREKEIEHYLEEHGYKDCFIILDDGPLGKLSDHLVRTFCTVGFDEERYAEAVRLLKEQKGNE